MNTIALATALVDDLNRQDFSLEFTATRQYVARRALDDDVDIDAPTLTVVVVPSEVESRPESRTVVKHDVTLDIGIVRRVGDELVDADALMGLADEILDWLKFRSPTRSGAKWLSAGYRLLYDPARLEQHSEFFSIIRSTYRVTKN